MRIKEVPFSLKLFKLVDTNDNIEGVITNNLTEDFTRLRAIEAIQVRWQVEEFDRKFKQLTGSEKCQCRTTIGDIDMLSEVAGVGNFADVRKESVSAVLFNCEVRILTIEGLIKAKRAAGRTKDLLVLPELEALQELFSQTKE